MKTEDAGQYSCEALNPVGKATCTAKLNVESMYLIYRIFKW